MDQWYHEGVPMRDEDLRDVMMKVYRRKYNYLGLKIEIKFLQKTGLLNISFFFHELTVLDVGTNHQKNLRDSDNFSYIFFRKTGFLTTMHFQWELK